MSVQLAMRRYDRGGRHRHDYCQILIPVIGAMRLDIAGQGGLVTGHSLAVIPAEHEHDFEPSRNCRMMVIDLDDTAAPTAEVPAVIRNRQPGFLAVDPWLSRLFSLIAREVEADPRRRDDAAAVALTGMRLIRPQPAPRPVTAAAGRLRDLAAHLDAAPAPIAVAAMARSAGLGLSQFHALFRATIGQSPAQYQLRRKLDRAADRLLNSADPVAVIAYDLGYQNPASFNRLFRRHFGVTPTAFRRAGRG